jgi:DICT domain-containing protein
MGNAVRKQEHKLTIKQEKFAHCLVFGIPGNDLPTQSDVYRHVYSVAAMSDKSVHENASALTSNTKVASRIDQLKQQRDSKAQQASSITIHTITGALTQAMQMSIDQDNPQALTNAAHKLAQVLGLDAPQRIETTNKTPEPLPTVDQLLEQFRSQAKIIEHKPDD